ncbi:MAG: hypothetical protein ACREF8_03315, partial [Chthoniobacterales bacterium]
ADQSRDGKAAETPFERVEDIHRCATVAARFFEFNIVPANLVIVLMLVLVIDSPEKTFSITSRSTSRSRSRRRGD